MHIGALTSTMILLLALLGCERGGPAPNALHHDPGEHAQQHEHRAAIPAAGAEKPSEPAGPMIETGSFRLAVAPTETGYSVGKTGELEIELESREPWHVNQDYPIRIGLTAAPGVVLKKSELVKNDAVEFGEKRARFRAGVEPSAVGEHEVACEVSFAMCTEENCILEKRTLATQIEVK